MPRPHFTGRSFLFGEFSRYEAREMVTRFSTRVWFVTDAELVNPETGLLEVVGQFDSLEAAKAAFGESEQGEGSCLSAQW